MAEREPWGLLDALALVDEVRTSLPATRTYRRSGDAVSDDVQGAFLVTVAFAMGAWNGWVWREIIARRHPRRAARPDPSRRMT